MPLTRNISFGGQLPALSEGRAGNQEELKELFGDDGHDFNVDDVLIDRSAGEGYGSTTYFGGLAVVFGAVGMASFMGASGMEEAASLSTLNTSRRLVGTDRITRAEPVSLTDSSEEYAEQLVE